MATKKIVFQIKSVGAIGNDKIDSNPLYENAVRVENPFYLTDGTQGTIEDHAAYVRDVLRGLRGRDNSKYPGIVWKPDIRTNTGTDYVNVEPDEFVADGEKWVVGVLDRWADSQGLKHDYEVKSDPITGKPAAYNSHHIYL